MKLKKLFLIICTICFAVALSCGIVACGGSGGSGDGGDKVIPVASVDLQKELKLEVGDEQTLTVRINPSNATDKSATWASSNPSVATVDGGKVKAVAEGECTVTVTVSDKQASCKVTVTEKVKTSVKSVGLTLPTLDLSLNETYTSLQPIILPAGATYESLTWSSSDPECVAVNEYGFITALSLGTATVTVTVDGMSAHCTVNVYEYVASITLSKTSLNLEVGGSETITATVLPEGVKVETVWSSSDESVATVKDGEICAVGVGTATITATAGAKSAKCTVNVKIIPVESIELDHEELTVYLGSTATLKATVKPENATDKEVKWETSDEKIATVDGGVITPVSKGVVTITAKAGGKSMKCTVTVEAVPVPVDSVELDEEEITIYIGETKTLTATVKPENASDKKVTWKSSAEEIASVDQNGVVTANGAGSATITAKAGDKEATCKVTVTAPIADNSIVTYAHAGEEKAAFEWKDTNASGAKVEYKLSSASSYTKVDSQLVRELTSDTARVDILGLKGGAKYDFKITSSSNQTVYALGVEIAKLDRSGYAHYVYKDGKEQYKGAVGAYNDDGTLKSNAEVIYLTESNKNNVKDGKSIAEYLTAAKNNKTPIVIRVLGTVGSATWNEIKYTKPSGSNLLPATSVKGNNNEQLPKAKETSQQDLIDGGFNTLNTKPAKYNGATCLPIRGLSSKATWDGSAYDSCWNDCSVNNVSNITVEGVGEDAEIFQWGFTFKNCNSVEVRNLRFFDYTEDACSFEGSGSSTPTITPKELSSFTATNYWVHHNVFDIGMNYWDLTDEQDKHDGDGATDFKRLAYVTVAYNRYNGTHKTGLVGSGDSVYQANFTFHHNYYNGCDQRMPLGRQANMHLYNNYYSSSGLYSVSLRASAYAYIENCVFTSKVESGKDATKPIELVESGEKNVPSAKVVDCEIKGTIVNGISGVKNLYEGDRAGATDVVGNNIYGVNFEKNLLYTVTNKLATDKIVETIPNVAGTMKQTRINNIKIDGSSQGGGGTGGGTDTPTISPDADKVTASIDSAVAAGTLRVSVDKNDKQDLTDVKLTSDVSFTAKQTTVSQNSPAVEFDDGYSFYHRVILGKYSSSNQRYFKITTDGAATIKVYAANLGSTGDRNIGLYTNKDATDTLVGSTTAFNSGEIKIVTISVGAKGTYYLLASTSGTDSADLSIFAIDVAANSGGDSGSTPPSEGTTYTYTHGEKAGSEWVSTSAGSNTSGDNVAGTKIEYSVEKSVNTSLTLKLPTNGTKATITMEGFTKASTKASSFVVIKLKADDGSIIGTLTGTTLADNLNGKITLEHEGIITTTNEFSSIEISCNTDGKHFSIVKLTITVE